MQHGDCVCNITLHESRTNWRQSCSKWINFSSKAGEQLSGVPGPERLPVWIDVALHRRGDVV